MVNLGACFLFVSCMCFVIVCMDLVFWFGFAFGYELALFGLVGLVVCLFVCCFCSGSCSSGSSVCKSPLSRL